MPAITTNQYPAAGIGSGGTSGSGKQISWDTWIYNDIGGANNLPYAKLIAGVFVEDPADAAAAGVAPALKILVCPFDKFTKVSWVTGSARVRPQVLCHEQRGASLGHRIPD